MSDRSIEIFIACVVFVVALGIGLALRLPSPADMPIASRAFGFA